MNKKLNTVPIKIYNEVENNINIIYKDNKNKCGIYRWVNKINTKSYIGSSINLSNRFRHYLSMKNITRITNNEKSYIYSAMIKHGYSCFILEILEYCDVNVVTQREQYYIDYIAPEYNILKTANTRLGYTQRIETKKAISAAIRKNISYNIIENSKKVSIKNQGINVKLLDKSGNIINIFPTLKSAAEYMNMSITTLQNIMKRGFSYDNYTYIFESKDSRIWIYDGKYVLKDILENAKSVCEKYKIPKSTLSNYINTGKLYKSEYYFYNIDFINKKRL